MKKIIMGCGFARKQNIVMQSTQEVVSCTSVNPFISPTAARQNLSHPIHQNHKQTPQKLYEILIFCFRGEFKSQDTTVTTI